MAAVSIKSVAVSIQERFQKMSLRSGFGQKQRCFAAASLFLFVSVATAGVPRVWKEIVDQMRRFASPVLSKTCHTLLTGAFCCTTKT